MVGSLDGEPGVYEIRLDEDIGAFVVTWHDDIDGEQYREGIERLLEHVEQHDVSNVLFDSREQGRMEPTDRAWTVESWEPRAVDACVDRVAIVYPADYVAKQTVDMTARRAPFSELEYPFTEDRDEAREWIRLL
jgi:hypothetical protein